MEWLLGYLFGQCTNSIASNDHQHMLGGVCRKSRILVISVVRQSGTVSRSVGSSRTAQALRQLHRRSTKSASILPTHSRQITSFARCNQRYDFRMALKGAPSITLDDKEAHLVSLLDGCCDWINAHRPQPNEEEGGTQVNYNASVEARIAGGWVRDKLLGMPSHDLDVSLSVMTGLNFAILFKAYLLQLSSNGSSSNRDSAGSIADAALAAMSRITKISANPEQSKSLETATANILGLDLDFVNLRKEVYDNPATRIPTMTFGTPQEDAERRDITINTLFFNVKTRQVEDWTGMGLQDLRAGLVRTPLPPLTTFLDDPLRVLRCVRFASRLNYRLDDSITDCLTGKSHGDPALYANDPRLAGLDASTMAKEGRQLLREALMTKVSRERVGVEVDKMMAGPFPLLAHQNLALLGLYELVFHPSSASIANLPVRHPSGAHELPDAGTSSRLTLLASQLVDALSQRPLSTMEGASVPQDTQAIDQVLPPSIRVEVPTQLRRVVADREQRRRLELASAFLAFEGWEIEEKKGKWAWCGDRVMMQGLKVRDFGR